MRVEKFVFPSFGDAANAIRTPRRPVAAQPAAPEHFEALSSGAAIVMDAVAPAPESISREQLDAASAEGFRAGEAAGYARGRADAEAQGDAQAAVLADTVARMTAALEALESAERDAMTRTRHEAVTLALAIARKVAGEALSANPLPEIERMVNDCADQLFGETPMTVTVHESLVTRVKDIIDRRVAASRQTAPVTVIGDALLEPGDCRVEWKNGGAQRSAEGLWEEIARRLGQTDTASGEATVVKIARSARVKP